MSSTFFFGVRKDYNRATSFKGSLFFDLMFSLTLQMVPKLAKVTLLLI